MALPSRDEFSIGKRIVRSELRSGVVKQAGILGQRWERMAGRENDGPGMEVNRHLEPAG